MLRINPEDEAIEMGADSEGQPLARFKIPCVGNIVLQSKALRYEHSCERCGTVYKSAYRQLRGLGLDPQAVGVRAA